MLNNLGQITAAVGKMINDRLNEEYGYREDMAAFGAPSECADFVFDEWDAETSKRIVTCVHSFKVPFNQFKKELEQRCDGRWLHVNGYDEIFSV